MENWIQRFNGSVSSSGKGVVEFTCPNCANTVSGHFCSRCGQRHIIFNLHYLGDRVLEAISLQRGLLFNLKVLTFIPGKAIKDYMDGRTRPFLNPISYSLLVLALLFLTGSRFEEDLGIGEYSTNFPFFIHYLIFTFPIMFAGGSMLAFAKEGYHFVQHFIISLFVLSHFVLIIFIPMEIVGMDWGEYLIFPFFIYSVWVYYLIFRRHLLVTILDLFVIFILSFLFELAFVAATIGWFL